MNYFHTAIGADFDVEIVNVEVKPKHVDLKEAKSIVSFGMGIKNNAKPALKMVEELAEGGREGVGPEVCRFRYAPLHLYIDDSVVEFRSRE